MKIQIEGWYSMDLDFGALHRFSTTVGVFWNWETCPGYSFHFDGYRRYVLLAGDVHHDLFTQSALDKQSRNATSVFCSAHPPCDIV